MIRYPVPWLTILSGALIVGTSTQSAARRGPIVRQVDHILVESADPEALFSFFADTLQLPEAWPLADSQGFTSGGIGAGNVNIEVFRYAQSTNVPVRRISGARYAGLAFEPYPLSAALQELKLRGIPYSPPEPYVANLPKGSQGVLWTTVSLHSFSRPGMSVFLYEYSTAFLRVEVRRKQLANRLTLDKGGPLGFHSVREIVIACTNLEREKDAWTQLLGKQVSPEIWRAGAGPVIHLLQGPEDQIREITCKIQSLDRAKAFLQKNQLSGSASSKEIVLNPSKIQGLRIRLTE